MHEGFGGLGTLSLVRNGGVCVTVRRWRQLREPNALASGL